MVGDGILRIERDGTIHKLVRQVDQVTFSAYNAQQSGQKVLYITERAVFELVAEGVMLREVAPGVDVEKEIFQRMDFMPLVADDLCEMDPALFR
jgi:propionate CoA-transferase